MLRRRSAFAMVPLLALGACSTTGIVPTNLAAAMAEAPTGTPTRLWLDGDRIVAAAVPVGPGALPPAVRTTIDAVAPRGELLWQGREWSGRGEGFRIEKRYRENGSEHVRSALIGDDGAVLERSHSMPLGEVPQVVMATVLSSGPHVDEARIVSGPEREEYWSCTVRNRIGWVLVVEVGLDGVLLRKRRQVEARIEL